MTIKMYKKMFIVGASISESGACDELLSIVVGGKYNTQPQEKERSHTRKILRILRMTKPLLYVIANPPVSAGVAIS